MDFHSAGKQSRRFLKSLILLSSAGISGALWAVPPSFSTSFNSSTIGPGNESTLTYTITNGDSFAITDLAFSNTLPAGVTISANPNASSTCLNGSFSAPANGTTISIADYAVEPNSSCNVTVAVTASAAGSYSNVTDDLTSSEGNSGTASATLTVDTGRPNIELSITPSSMSRGDIAQVQVVFDNSLNGSLEYNFQSTISLPGGLAVADFPDVQTTCTNTSVTANSGSDVATITPTGTMTLGAGASCTSTFNAVATGVGSYLATSSLTYLDSNTFTNTVAGFSSASVDIATSAALISFLNNPVAPGSSTDLEITLANTDRSNSVTNAAFTIDLDAALSGLVATGLPLSDICGSGSSVSGTSVLSFTGGAISAGSTCTFTVPVTVPGGAAVGTYTGTSSDITWDIGGSGEVKSGANFSLSITQAPTLAINFVDSDAVGGGSTNVEFTITNTDSANAATAITFRASISDLVSGSSFSSLPASGYCGAGSTASQAVITDELYLLVSNAQLAAGASCTFTVGINIPQGAPAGVSTLQSSDFSATVNGSTLTGETASDSINIVGGPSLKLALSELSINPGDTTTATFTLAHSASASANATSMAFTLDLDAAISGLTAVGLPSVDVCGTGSQISGTSTLTFTGGSLAPNETCSFDVTLQTPGSVSSNIYTLTTSSLDAQVSGLSTSSIAGSASLQVSNLEAAMAFTNLPVAPGGTANLEVTLTNASATEALSAVVFTSSISSTLSGMTVTGLPANDICGAGSQATGTTTLIVNNGSLAAGGSCTFTLSLSVPGGASDGTYPLVTSNIGFTENAVNININKISTTLIVETDVAPNVTLTSSASPSTSVSPIPVSMVFNEDVTGFDVSDLTGSVTNGSLSNFQAISASEYSVDITPAAAGDVTLQVPASSAIDSGTNGNNVSDVLTITYDPVAFILPTAVIGAPDQSLTNTGPVNFAVTYSNADQVSLDDVEVVLVTTGTATGDVSVANGNTTTPTVTLSNITGEGSIAISLTSGTARNSFGNADAVGTSAAFNVDNTAPDVSISSAAPDPTNAAFDVTFTFTEAVNDFVNTDVTASNASVSTLSGGPVVYTATITPDTDGTVTLDVLNSVASDSAGNGNTAATQYSVLYDATAPSGYDINIDQSFINAANDTAMSFSYTGAEVGADYNYSVSDGSSQVSGVGTIASASDSVTGIDVSGLAEGTLTLTFVLTDPVGNMGVAITDTVIKQYNDAPVITEGATITVNMSEDSTPTAFNLTLNATDPENESLTWSVISSAINGVADATGTGNSQVVSYTPLANYNGSDSFVVEVTDNNALEPLTDSITVTVQITAVNDAPTFTSSAPVVVAEDALYTYSITTNDIDAGDTLAITASVIPSWLSLVDNGNGTATLAGSPTNDDVGVHSVTLLVTDSSGASDNSATQSFSVAVSNTNDAPTFTSTPVTVATEDQAYSYAVTAADIDVGDSIAITATVLPSWLTLVDNGNGAAVLSGTPLNEHVGNHSVTLVVTDDSGDVNDTAAQSFVVAVANTNDSPSGLPVITGTLLRNETLTADTSGISDDDGLGTFSYQWLRNSNPIAGASSATYTPGVDDVWQILSVTVSYTDLGGNPESLTSAPTGAISDLDSDGDGIYDLEEGTGDSDGDGTPDYLDPDSDNDGIPDSEEGTGDSDGDGTPDYLDTSLDEDSDGIPDIIESESNRDTDGDGLRDFEDPDSDNDGLTDLEESGVSGIDTDGDGIDDYYDVDQTGGVDANGDGIDDAVMPLDSDNDGIPDYIDRDSDNDGIPDALENEFAFRTVSLSKAMSYQRMMAIDTDGDGILNHVDPDSDNDGLSDAIEAQIVMVDTDGDQIIDQFDVDVTGGVDANQDGVDDNATLVNSDNDNTPDLLDLDSDNDGRFDIVEAGLIDSDFDALIDNPTDAVVIAPDTDNDGTPDYLDLDSNDDSTWDIESTGAATLDLNGDGQIDDASSDPDNDGIVDPLDDEPNQFGTQPDRDGDGVPGRIDRDDDNDGISDVAEGLLDSDGDGLIDALDSDSDNDGLNDAFETDRPRLSGIDIDRDGIDDAVDVDFVGGNDSDNDGVADQFRLADTDGDGTPDYLDTDSDNDGISDQEEQLTVILGGTDVDNDGLDDVVDATQTAGDDANGDGQVDRSIDSSDLDGDGLLAFRDSDTDGDGIADGDENGDFNNDGINDRLQTDPGVSVDSGSGSVGWMMLGLLALFPLRKRKKGKTDLKLPFARIWLGSFVSFIALSVPSLVSADDQCLREQSSCWYLGWGIGRAQHDIKDGQSAWKVSDNDGQYGTVFVGVDFSSHLYWELAYEQLGRVQLRNQNPAINVPGSVRFDSLSTSLGVWLRPHSADWNLGLSAGISVRDEKPQNVQFNSGDDSMVMYGVAVKWSVTETTDIKTKFTYYDNDTNVFGVYLIQRFD
ncbi:Ig-like domain-containing protein [Pleionea litopenaei]|uniref:Ig-like domain-containing protein n=1 Tax=Pleionea litopenaei TaxID=3070815 RepID=A0AA51X7N6_9GAMM|nr:Ig-like domain-containing protein [Pleionea sp. HL-JVS1]WMS87295.1 Ig-like domain-containing protein [Pleionea sp. HL-JVS1]